MAKMGKADFSGLLKYQKQVAQLSQRQADKMFEAAIKELAAFLLREVKQHTPVYQKIPGDVNARPGGTLRRSWTIGAVSKSGGKYTVKVINPQGFTSFVEYGHRGVYIPTLGKTMHTDTHFTEGRFMLTIAQDELEKEAPVMLERKIEAYLRRAFK